MALTQEQKSLIELLIDGAEKSFKNACALYAEATLLGNNGSWARGLCLHQLSLEECGKIDMLCAAVMQILLRKPLDLRRLQKAFTSHEAKNKANAYYLTPTPEEATAINNDDSTAALEVFRNQKESFHKDSNDAKNASLYVDFKEQFTSPLDRFTEADFVRIRERNDKHMQISDQFVNRMLQQCKQDIDKYQEDAAKLLDFIDIGGQVENSRVPISVARDHFKDKIKEFAQLILEGRTNCLVLTSHFSA